MNYYHDDKITKYVTSVVVNTDFEMHKQVVGQAVPHSWHAWGGRVSKFELSKFEREQDACDVACNGLNRSWRDHATAKQTRCYRAAVHEKWMTVETVVD